MPKAGQTFGGSQPNFLTLCLAGSCRARFPGRLQAARARSRAASPSLLGWEFVPPGTALHRTQRCCRNPTAPIPSLTSPVCWKRPQQPSGAGAAREVSTDSSALFQGEKKSNTIPSHLLWWPRLTSQCLGLPGSGIVKPCKRLRGPGACGRKVGMKTGGGTGSQSPSPPPGPALSFPLLSAHCQVCVMALHILTSQHPFLCSP